MTTTADKFTMLYDTELKRPACVLLQAVAGDYDRELFYRLFNSQDWLAAPTPGMKRITGTLAEWETAAQMTARARPTTATAE